MPKKRLNITVDAAVVERSINEGISITGDLVDMHDLQCLPVPPGPDPQFSHAPQAIDANTNTHRAIASRIDEPGALADAAQSGPVPRGV